MVWLPILILCSVTEDSSFGGAAGAASAGLSAGLASLSCARAVMAIAVVDKASAGSTLRFFTRIIFLSSEQTGICDLAKLRFYLFPRNPGLFCSTAEEQKVFVGRGGMQKNSGAVIDDPIRASLLEFCIARGAAYCQDARSSPFPFPAASPTLLADNPPLHSRAPH